jgi:hypothetical protein
MIATGVQSTHICSELIILLKQIPLGTVPRGGAGGDIAGHVGGNIQHTAGLLLLLLLLA